MLLERWACRWGIPTEALDEMKRIMGIERYKVAIDDNVNEAAVSAQVRVEAAEAGGVLWRNNVGAAVDRNGRSIRYGLCNDSERINRRFKSSDLVGIMPTRITEKHLGTVVGRFTVRECKHASWTYKGDDREKAQLRFIELIIAMGGDATFARGRGTI